MCFDIYPRIYVSLALLLLQGKLTTPLAENGIAVHSFRTLMQKLATLACKVTCTALNPKAKFILTTRPAPLQERAFARLGVIPARTQQPAHCFKIDSTETMAYLNQTAKDRPGTELGQKKPIMKSTQLLVLR